MKSRINSLDHQGGGIVMKPENWGLLHHGVVVYLDMDAQDIYDRYSQHAASVAVYQ